MYTRPERQRGTLLRLVDKQKLNEHLNRIHQAQWATTGAEVTRIRADNIAIGFTKESKTWSEDSNIVVICSEGVGWEVNDQGLIIVPVSYIDNGMYEFAVSISFPLLRECLIEDTVDLADFIRVFGDRLENNFCIWKQKCI